MEIRRFFLEGGVDGVIACNMYPLLDRITNNYTKEVTRKT